MPAPPSNPPNEGARLVLTTFPEEAVGKAIARQLVEERLAACVSLIPNVHSVYTWEGKVNDDREWLGLVKTQADTYPNLEQRLEELHPYDTPEILAFDVAAGSPAYLKWLASAVTS